MAITQIIATLPAVLNDSATFYEDIAERNNSLVTTVLPSINAWALQANTTQTEINEKAAQVAAQAIDGGYSQNYINSNFFSKNYINDNFFSQNYINDNFIGVNNAQDITEVKTFTISPIVPTPTTDFQPVPLKSTNITVSVGAGQTYTTINQALEYLSGFYPMYKKSGVTATINLKAGFVMAEQVLVSGIDLGWIIIAGENAETIITHTALTTAFFDGTSYPAFGIDKGGTSPIIGQLFRFNVEKVGGNKYGLMTHGAGSSATVLSGKGFIGAGTNGIYAVSASTVNAQYANCSNAGSNGICAENSSTINAYGANCSNAGSNGICSILSSTIGAYGANCSNAGINGVYAENCSTINARDTNCSNAGINGVCATLGSTINAYGANCSNAGSNGIYAEFGSTIGASNAMVQNQITGAARLVVSYGSQIIASDIITTGGTVPVFSQAVNTLTGNGIIYQ